MSWGSQWSILSTKIKMTELTFATDGQSIPTGRFTSIHRPIEAKSSKVLVKEVSNMALADYPLFGWCSLILYVIEISSAGILLSLNVPTDTKSIPISGNVPSNWNSGYYHGWTKREKRLKEVFYFNLRNPSCHTKDPNGGIEDERKAPDNDDSNFKADHFNTQKN